MRLTYGPGRDRWPSWPMIATLIYAFYWVNCATFDFVWALVFQVKIDSQKYVVISLYAPISVGRRHYKMMSDVRLSVCHVHRPNSRTERPRKPKIGRMEAHRTRNPWNYLEIKRSKVKATGSQSVKALLLAATYAYMRTFAEGWHWSSHSQQPCCSSVAVTLHSLL